MSVSGHAVPIAVYEAGQAKDARQKNMTTSTAEDRWLSNALLPGAFLLFAGGMDMAQGLGWNMYTGVESTAHFRFCWFIGGIVGAMLAASLITLLRKRLFMRFSAMLIIIAGIIYVSAPRNYAGIVAARYLNGIAIGITIIPFIVYASEIATRKCRGSYLAMEQISISLGIGVQIIYASQWTSHIDLNANQLHGIFGILAGILCMSFSFLMIESPIFYIRNNLEADALACQQKLMRVNQLNDATRFVFEDNKNYVLENENRTSFECWAEALQPTLKMFAYRTIVAFSFSLPLSVALQQSYQTALGYGHTWPAIIYGVLRMLCSLITIYLLDTIGRKLIALFALLFVAILSIANGGIFSQNENIFNDYTMAIACTLLLIQQIFAGLFAPSTSVYLGEAFPMSIKPYLIAGCIGIEYLIQLIVICTFQPTAESIFDYLVTVGVIMFVFCICFGFIMPETRNTTLREAQDKFRRFLNRKFY